MFAPAEAQQKANNLSPLPPKQTNKQNNHKSFTFIFVMLIQYNQSINRLDLSGIVIGDT